MGGIQAFILSMIRESQNRYIYGKSNKGDKKPTSTFKRLTLGSLNNRLPNHQFKI